MTRKLFNVLLIFVMALSLATAALAQVDSGHPDVPAALNQGGAKSYVVVMDLRPIVSYEGDVEGSMA